MELVNYKQHCRLCLKARNASKNIFSHTLEGCQETLVQIIFSLFKIELHSHNAYPQFICRKCLTEVESVLLFKEDLLRNQEFLLGLFRSAYPNYVEKKTNNSRKIYSSNCSSTVDLASSGRPGYLRFQEGYTTLPDPQVAQENVVSNSDQLAVKNPPVASIPASNEGVNNNCKYCNASFKFKRALQEHYSKSHSLEQAPREDNITKNVRKKIVKNNHLRNDKNKNVAGKHLPQQQTEISDSDQNKSNLRNAKFSKGLTSDNINPAEPVIPQASFLQNLNLISLQDAEVLRTRQEPLSRPRRTLLSKKYNTLDTMSVNISKTKNMNKAAVNKSPSALSKKVASNEKSLDLLTYRSVNFLSRYGCRNLDYTTCQKRGKVLHKADNNSLNQHQHKKSVNKFSSKEIDPSRGKISSLLGPRRLVERQAVLKEKGCDTRSNLSNNNKYKHEISASEIKLETDKLTEDDVEIENLLKEDDNTTENTNTNNPLDVKASQQIHTINVGLKKSELPSHSHYQSSHLYEPVLPKDFYHSKPTTQNQGASLENFETLRNDNVQANNVYSHPSGRNLRRNSRNSANTQPVRKSEKNCSNNGLKMKLFRSASLNDQSGFESEPEKDIWSIGRASTYAFRSSPNRLKASSKLERSESLDKIVRHKNTLYQVEEPNKVSDGRADSGGKLDKSKSSTGSKCSVIVTRSCKSSEDSPISKRKRRRQSQAPESSPRSDDIKEDLKLMVGLMDSLACADVAPDRKRKKEPSPRRSKNAQSTNNGTIKGERPIILQRRSQNTPQDRLREIKIEESSHRSSLSENENTNPLGLDSCRPDTLDNTSPIEKLEMKEVKQELLKTGSEENIYDARIKTPPLSVKDIDILKYDTQESDDNNIDINKYSDGLPESISAPTFYGLQADKRDSDDLDESVSVPTADKKLLMGTNSPGKVWNVNVSEDEEFQLMTLAPAELKVNTAPEDFDNMDLSEYSRQRLTVKIKCHQEKSPHTRSKTGDLSNRVILRQRLSDVSIIKEDSDRSRSSSRQNKGVKNNLDIKVKSDLPLDSDGTASRNLVSRESSPHTRSKTGDLSNSGILRQRLSDVSIKEDSDRSRSSSRQNKGVKNNLDIKVKSDLPLDSDGTASRNLVSRESSPHTRSKTGDLLNRRIPRQRTSDLSIKNELDRSRSSSRLNKGVKNNLDINRVKSDLSLDSDGASSRNSVQSFSTNVPRKRATERNKRQLKAKFSNETGLNQVDGVELVANNNRRGRSRSAISKKGVIK